MRFCKPTDFDRFFKFYFNTQSPFSIDFLRKKLELDDFYELEALKNIQRNRETSKFFCDLKTLRSKKKSFVTQSNKNLNSNSTELKMEHIWELLFSKNKIQIIQDLNGQIGIPLKKHKGNMVECLNIFTNIHFYSFYPKTRIILFEIPNLKRS
jgi:hypothetical protein